jgi:hypothetical protein
MKQALETGCGRHTADNSQTPEEMHSFHIDCGLVGRVRLDVYIFGMVETRFESRRISPLQIPAILDCHDPLATG